MITIESIQARVATSFGISLFGMMSHRRDRHLARPRQIAMYLSRRITDHKMAYIGYKFANRDHSTVIHAIKNIESLMAVDPAFAARVNGIRGALELATVPCAPRWPDVYAPTPRRCARALVKDIVSAIAVGGEAVIALPTYPYAGKDAVALIRVWVRTLFRDAIVTKQAGTITVRRAGEGELS